MNRKESSRFSPERLSYLKNLSITLLLIALILVAVVLPTATSVYRRIEARPIQGVAKNIELSVRLLSLEFVGTQNKLLNPNRNSGFTVQGEARIREMSGAQGDFYLLAWNANEGVIQHLLYEEKDYMVEVIYQGKGAYTWEVSHLEGVLR